MAVAVRETTDTTGPEPAGSMLSEEQELAVARRTGPLMLSAAAGSGKTTVLAERFARAVHEDGLRPAQILALTFTDRAAGELRERVRARLLELGDGAAARDTEAAFVGTFHSFCVRLLRTHGLAAGVEPGFAILDEGLAARLADRAFDQSLAAFAARAGAVDLLAAYSVDRVRGIVAEAYAALRSRGQLLPRLPALSIGAVEAGSIDELAAAAWTLFDELLRLFGERYAALKRERAALDFDDLELLARDLLLRNERLSAEWRERFALLMVDEFQDTNERQLAILQALERDNLFTVGDELQAIYGFRHADVELFRERRERLAARGAALRLARNFRARAPLLDVVDAIFAERFEGYVPLVPARGGAAEADEARRDAPPVSEVGRDAPAASEVGRDAPAASEVGRDAPAASEARVELLLTNTRDWEPLADAVRAGLPHAQAWRAAEARLLARRIGELVRSGEVRAGEVAVLTRAGGDLEVFERALEQEGLRTLAAIGDFWSRQQVRDLVAYLRALANPLDEEALYGLLASPLVGCSLDSLAALAGEAHAAGRPAWELARDKGDSERPADAERERIAAACAWLERERAQAPRRPLAALIERALTASGYEQHVLGLRWGHRRLANVHKLLRVARRFEAGQGRDLRGFLDHVAFLERARKTEPDAPVEGQDPDAVRLMTIHVAKGLEFGVVCVADLGRQPNTQTPDLLVDGDRSGLRLARLDGNPSEAALDYEELCRLRRRREAEEEDRILYVAMTRARERLLLSGSADFASWRRSCAAPPPITWIAPALSADLPERALAGEAGPFVVRAGARHTPVRCLLSSARDAAELLGVGPTSPAAYEQQPLWQEEPEPAPVEPGAAPAGLAAPAPEPAQDPAIPAAAISTLSYSSLAELERCAYRYYLERVLRLPEDRAGGARAQQGRAGLDARARGTLVHRLMESFDFARPQPPTTTAVARVADELGMRVSPEEGEQIAELLRAAGGEPLSARVAAARAVHREYRFAFALGPAEPVVNGVIDLLAEQRDGSWLVLDYKSDRVTAAVDLRALVERDYGAQRLLYALAVLRRGAARVEVVHWFLERAAEPVVAVYTAGEREALERELAARLARARASGFAVSSTPNRELCAGCPGRGRLCSWPESETLRDPPGV
jgi:ATP-dependent exoDNAse (exonuclease V) beta subunit